MKVKGLSLYLSLSISLVGPSRSNVHNLVNEFGWRRNEVSGTKRWGSGILFRYGFRAVSTVSTTTRYDTPSDPKPSEVFSTFVSS